MKNIHTLLLLFILATTTVLAQPKEQVKVKWYTFEDAIELNKTNPKKIFIDVYTDWCSWCKVMDNKTFSNPEIAQYLNTHFYPVKFNAESTEPITFQGIKFENKQQGRRSTHELAVALLQGKLSYPSVAYMDEESRLLTAVPGYYPAAKMEPMLKYFGGDHYKTTAWDEFSKWFIGVIKDEEE